MTEAMETVDKATEAPVVMETEAMEWAVRIVMEAVVVVVDRVVR